mgnify:CR=1 FL=1
MNRKDRAGLFPIFLLLLLIAAASCDRRGGSSTFIAPTEYPNQYANIGYGLANTWNLQSPGTFAETLRKHGIGRTLIELRPNTLALQEATPQTVKAFISAMRAQGILPHVALVNWNCRNSGQCPTAQEVGESAARLAGNVGTDGITAEVSEPNASAEEQRSITLARERWPGEFAVNWGFPYPAGLAFQARSIHECSADPSGWNQSGDILHITDCTASLTGNAGGIAAWARRTGQRIILYDLNSRATDQAVLDDILAALK